MINYTWETSTSILLYKGLPIAMEVGTGSSGFSKLLDFDISNFKDLKNRKLLAQLDMWFNTDVSQYQEKEHTGVFRVEYYIGDNFVGTRYIDLVLYSPGALVNSGIIGYNVDTCVKITLDEQTISRIDFIHVFATNYGALLYAVELDGNGEVIRHTKSVTSHLVFTPHKSTRTIYVTSLPHTYPWHNVAPDYYVSIYGKYVPGLPRV